MCCQDRDVNNDLADYYLKTCHPIQPSQTRVVEGEELVPKKNQGSLVDPTISG